MTSQHDPPPRQVQAEKLELAVFDLDGTLKAVRSPYGHVHRALGVHQQAARIVARYQRGELTHEEWGQQEIALWRGLRVDALDRIVRQIPYWPGAVDFVRRLKAGGVRVALVSAGFDLHVQLCAAELGADLALYNQLGVSNGRLTGEFSGGVDGHNKGDLVRQIQDRFQVGAAGTLAAGDTLYDIPMFREAEISVAVAPQEPAVAEAADLLLPDGDWAGAWDLIEGLRPGWLPPAVRPRQPAR